MIRYNEIKNFKFTIFFFYLSVTVLSAQDAPSFISFSKGNDNWELTEKNTQISILVDKNESSGVHNAVEHFQKDFENVTGISISVNDDQHIKTELFRSTGE